MTRKNQRKIDSLLDDDDDDEELPHEKIMRIQKIAGMVALIAGVIGAALTWLFAPVVGGVWWPYIHIIVTLVGAVLVMKVTALIVGWLLMSEWIKGEFVGE